MKRVAQADHNFGLQRLNQIAEHRERLTRIVPRQEF